MQAGNGRGGRERRAGPAPGGGRGQLPQPRVNVPPAVPTNPAPQPPIPRRTGGIPRSLFYLSLLSIVLPLEGAVLGQTAAVQPVAAAQHYGLTNAVQPSILAYDCFHPRNVKTYDLSQHCPKQKQAQDGHRRAEVYILQQDYTHRAQGFRCSMTIGSRRYICGSFSYEKSVRGPVGQLPVSITGAECHRLVSTRQYKDEKKQIHAIKVPGLNEISVEDIGWDSTADGDQRCQGERADIDGHPVDRIVEYATVVISIKAEEFILSHEKVSAEYSRESLSCPANQGKCTGASHAYTWNPMTAPPCPWKIARTSHGYLKENVYFSTVDGILFELSQPTRDVRCPGLKFRQTGYDELALVEERPNLPRLDGGDVKVTLLVQVFQEFLMDRLNQLASNDEQTYTNLECEEHANNEEPGVLRALGNGQFSRRMGDTHVEFSCPTVEVNLREDTHCYLSEIPVQNDQYPFVTVANRVLTTVGHPSPCLDDFPLRVKGTRGWWRLLPRIEADVPPRSRATVEEPLHHQFDRQGGLYSVGELRQWQHLQEVPQYQRLLTADLAQGVCSGIEGCALTPVPGAPAYTLANLESDVLEAVTPEWLVNLKLAVYWGGIILAWCSPVGFFFILWKQPRQKLEASTNMVPLNIHTNSVTPVTLPPTIVTTEFQPTVNEGRVQLALEDHRAGVPLRPQEVSQHEGGCRVDQLDGVNRRNHIVNGPSKAEERALARMTLNTA